MTKKLLTFVLILSALCYVNAQRWTGIQQNAPKPAEIKLLSGTNDESVIGIKLYGFTQNDVITPRGSEVTISVLGASPAMWKDAPDLPKLTASVIIPETAKMQAEVISSKYVEFSDINIAPSKGNLMRNVDPDLVPYVYGKPYQINEFFPGKLCELREPYIVRDFRGQTLVIYPFQYNPVTKVLRVYYELQFKIKPTGEQGSNILIRKNAVSKVDSEFSKIYQKLFLNYSAHRYTPVEEEGNMLIISYGQYMPAMQPFIDWKTTTGMHVNMVNISSIGTNPTAIKNYVQHYYDSAGITYLLLVGDAQHIPPYTQNMGGPSDNAYGYVVGTDHYPDVFVGRFSAESIADVQTQVQRSIEYEMGPDTTGGWLAKGICIASDEGGGSQGDNGESDKQHQRIIYNKLLGYTYNAVQELFDGYLAGGTDVLGNPSAADLRNKINEGSGIISYTGHGSDNSFVTTGFSNNDIATLTNKNQLPFIWSVACVNGNFQNQTCFAEAWLRATKDGEPTGAVATLMSTINQSWNPPMRGQDEMIDILVESYQNNIKRTFGGLSMNGCMKMNDVYGSQGESMTDTWTCFGDPSLMVRTKNWDEMTVSHPGVVPIGTSQIQVNCNVEGAKIAITLDGQILGTGFVNAGVATINFSPLASVDTLTVCATAYNKKPYIGQVLIIVPSGPYLIFKSHTINDQSGNNNGRADFGESVLLNVTLENVGVDMADYVTATIASSDPYVNIINNSAVFGVIPSSSQSTIYGAYEVAFAPNIPDNRVVPFTITMSDNNSNTWTGTFSITANAPSFIVGTIEIDDSNGNNNHILDPGETANLIITATNNGHSNAPNTTSSLATQNTNITINTATAALGTVNSGAIANSVFPITVSPNAMNGSVVSFDFSIVSGNYSANKTFQLKVGIISEDFETGNFNQYPWHTSGNAPWFVSTHDPYEGTSCVQSGDIGANQNSFLEISFNVLSNDSISFYKKVSCEDNPYGYFWDYLKFEIDGNIMGQWDGEVAWSREAYPVSAGNHTFTWTYVKDGYADEGYDCAWLDFIIFPPVFDSSTEVTPVVHEINFNLYPNPAPNTATLTYTVKTEGNFKIILKDYTSRTIKELVPNVRQLPGTYKHSFSTSDLSTGVYYISVISENGILTRPIIIAR